MELAEFSTEIDIHIEALRSDYEQLEALEIFKIQLDAVELYIKKALRLGVDKVYIIHGKGTGRLKKAVHEILENNPHVKSYKAGYFQKYGVDGATEVIF
jgi:dsDNA-specific endonuclease/ATPase MutS2